MAKESETNSFKTDHLNHDSIVCLTPGLFRSSPKGRKGEALFLTYETPKTTFEFMGPFILGPKEMRVLQGLIALSSVSGDDGKSKLELNQGTVSAAGLEHRRTLEPSGGAFAKTSVVTRTTFYELAKEIGYADSSFHSGHQTKQLRSVLERLWATSLIAEDKDTGVREGSHFLSQYQSDPKTGKFTVAINFHVTETILGLNKKYTRIDMAEIRALKTDPARLIHQRLCAWIDQGKAGKITLEGLNEYVWHEPATNVNTMRRRKTIIRKALAELESLGWTVDEYVKNKYLITRRDTPN
jgi:hypothetical protein